MSGCADPACPYVEQVHAGRAGMHVEGYRRMLGRPGAAGPFAPTDVAAVQVFQRAEGLRATGAIGPATHVALVRHADGRARELLRLEYAARHPRPAGRELVVRAALHAFDRRGRIVYSGRNRATVGRRWQGIDDGLVPPRVPEFADCSSLATWCLWTAREHGARDPSDRGWAPGSTATMEPNGRLVTLAEAAPGDLLFYANANAEGHVAILVERVRDVPFVVSFGAEGGPEYVRWDYRRRRGGAVELTSARAYIDAEV